jgi:hypothetical protein
VPKKSECAFFRLDIAVAAAQSVDRAQPPLLRDGRNGVRDDVQTAGMALKLFLTRVLPTEKGQVLLTCVEKNLIFFSFSVDRTVGVGTGHVAAKIQGQRIARGRGSHCLPRCCPMRRLVRPIISA